MCQRQTSCQSCKLWPPDHCQCDHCILDSSSQHCSNCQRKYQTWKSQKQVRNTHQYHIYDSTAPSADQSNHGSHNCYNYHQQQCRINARCTSHQYSGQHISSISVRSQKMFCTWRFLCLKKILCIWIIRTDFRCKSSNNK